MATAIKKPRRRGPDRVINTVNYLVLITWLVFFVAFLMVTFAKTPTDALVFRSVGTRTGVHAGSMIKWISIIFMLAQLVLSVVGLVMQSSRMKRKSDKYSKSLIAFVMIAILGLILMVFLG